MITANEVRERTHATFLDSDLSKIDEMIKNDIKGNKMSFGISVHDTDIYSFYNLKLALESVVKNGYDVYEVIGKDKMYAIIWNDLIFKEKCKIENFKRIYFN